MAVDPNLVAGQDMLSSGTGIWTITTPPNVSVAIDDPAVRAPIPAAGGVVTAADETMFPTVKLTDVLSTATTNSEIGFIGDATSLFPNPPDSVGFTANAEIDMVNNTGHTLNSLVLTLTDAAQQMPLDLVPGVVEYGHTVNANYPFFTSIQPVTGETATLATPSGTPTTAAGAAASKITLTGPIAPGATVSLNAIIHNTEQFIPSNNFVMNIAAT